MKKLSFTWINGGWLGLMQSIKQKLQAVTHLLKIKQGLAGKEGFQYQEYFPIDRAYFKQYLLSKKRKQKIRIKILFIAAFVSTMGLLLYNMAFNLQPMPVWSGTRAGSVVDVQVK